MKVTEAEIIISAVGPKQYPSDALPEIALAGRSNVGKSSLINRLVNRKKLARTSGTPGKTQTLNFYRVNHSFYFVDLPGYGFARVSKQIKNEWGRMIEQYLTHRDLLKGVMQIVDLRHPPSQDDVQMHDWLTHFQIPTIVVATKADKLSRGKQTQHLKVISQQLNLKTDDPLCAFSAESGQGKDELWRFLHPLI